MTESSCDVLIVGRGAARLARQKAAYQGALRGCDRGAPYVDPDAEQLHHPDPVAVREAGLLGQYRRDSDWDEWADDPRHRNATKCNKRIINSHIINYFNN